MNFCIHCFVECTSETPDHLVDCPFNTNLWPVNNQDLECELGCINCGHDFNLDEYYIVSDPAGEILCIDCSIKDWVNCGK